MMINRIALDIESYRMARFSKPISEGLQSICFILLTHILFVEFNILLNTFVAYPH